MNMRGNMPGNMRGNIREISWSNPADREAFIELPWQIYTDPQRWIPPLRDSVASELSAGNNFFQHGRAAAFLVEENDQVLGRIVASVDEHLPQKEIGHFGYFECVDHPGVAQALLSSAENWLREQGRSVVHGPVNLNIYSGYRIQTAGFETRPFLGEPRSPKYYAPLLERAGYGVEARWHSWDIPAEILPQLQRYMLQQAEAMESQNPMPYHLERLNLADLDNYLAKLHPLAMEIFAENYGFTPLSLKEFLQVYQSLIFIYQRHPDLLGMFYQGDEAVGFGYIYPDYGPFFQAANGEIEHMAQFPKAEAEGMIFHTFGIVQKHRGSNVSYSMFAKSFDEVLKRKHRYVIGALAKEGRTAYDQLGKPSRSYAVFSRKL